MQEPEAKDISSRLRKKQSSKADQDSALETCEPKQQKSERPETGLPDEQDLSAATDVKQCPFCAETIKAQAIKCRFCGELFSSIPAAAIQAQKEQTIGELIAEGSSKGAVSLPKNQDAALLKVLLGFMIGGPPLCSVCTGNTNSLMGACVLSLVIGLYFLPSVMAISAGKKNLGAIFVVNLFLGWTIIGWVVALSWSQIKE